MVEKGVKSKYADSKHRVKRMAGGMSNGLQRANANTYHIWKCILLAFCSFLVNEQDKITMEKRH